MVCHATTARGGREGRKGKSDEVERKKRVQSRHRAVLSEELQRHKHRGDLGNSMRSGGCVNVGVCCGGEGTGSVK